MGFAGGGDSNNHRASHHHLNFHLHFPNHHHHHHEPKDIPKGCLAVMVGTEEDRQQRFVIPVMYINHPLFVRLLKEAEEEYGFDQKGPITIPCHVDVFRTVQGMIDKEISSASSVHGGSHHQQQQHHQHHNLLCFRV